jgi:hypothetical protein
MHRILRYTALTTMMMLLGASWLAAQKTQQIFVKVTGPGGAAISDLQASEVTVAEDGVACKVLKLEPADWPTKVQVLVDNGPVNTEPINGLRDGLQGFFEKMPQGIELSMYTTAPQGRPIVKPTTDRQKLIAGIALISPDHGAGAFFDSLLDATDRVNKDKTPGFPVIVMVGSDVGVRNLLDKDIEELQQNIIRRAITIHVVLMQGGGFNRTSQLGNQPEIGMSVTKMTGGVYENINTTTRLATLLPALGERIAQSDAKQRHQYRVTYEPPGKRNPKASVGVTVARGEATTTLDGRIP